MGRGRPSRARIPHHTVSPSSPLPRLGAPRQVSFTHLGLTGKGTMTCHALKSKSIFLPYLCPLQ